MSILGNTTITGLTHHQFLTVSIGVATIIPNKQRTEKEMFNVADEALYKAKDQGRNQVYSISMDY